MPVQQRFSSGSAAVQWRLRGGSGAAQWRFSSGSVAVQWRVSGGSESAKVDVMNSECMVRGSAVVLMTALEVCDGPVTKPVVDNEPQ